MLWYVHNYIVFKLNHGLEEFLFLEKLQDYCNTKRSIK